MVLEIESTAHFDETLAKAGELPVVIDFHATWCGPCRQIKPVFEELAG